MNETASYVAALTGELSRLCRLQGLEMLAYLLEMAQLEAEQTAQRLRHGETQGER
jgi:hypothetical protein